MKTSDKLDATTVERCAQEIEEFLEAESGAEYGMMSDFDRSALRARNRETQEYISAIRSLIPNSANEIHSSDGGVEVADTQKQEICPVEFRGKKSLGALPGSRASTADATALPSSAGVAPGPSEAITTPTLREALEQIVQKRNELRENGTVTPDNAFEAFGRLNKTLCEFGDIARAALASHVEQEPEPVAWQYRVMFDKKSPREHEWCDWQDCNKEYHRYLENQIAAGRTRLQIRALHDHAASPRLDREKVAATFKAAFDRAYMNAADEETAQDLAIEAGIDAIMRETR